MHICEVFVLHHLVDGVRHVQNRFVVNFDIGNITQKIDVSDFYFYDFQSSTFRQIGFQLLFPTMLDQLDLVVKNNFR